MSVAEPDGRNGWISAEGRRSKIRVFPHLLGDESETGARAQHRLEDVDGVAAVIGRNRILAALLGQDWPQVSGALVGGCPGMAVGRTVTVSVTVVAVPTWTVDGVALMIASATGSDCATVMSKCGTRPSRISSMSRRR
jgi:hypothetical protein